MTWTDRPTNWDKPGHPDLGGEKEAILDQISDLTAPDWIDYTPVWAAGGTAPALGNGTLTGRYRQPAGSDLILFEVHLIAGTTTTFGTLFWSFTTPVTMHANTLAHSVGQAGVLDSSAGAFFPCITRLFTTTTVVMNVPAGTSVTNLVPYTWATTDEVRLSMWGQPA